MVTEESESYGSRAETEVRWRRGKKEEVYEEVLSRLKYSEVEEAKHTNFDFHLWSHFTRLPSRYALDVNIERAEDVLMHKRLLHLARNPSNRPVFNIRLVRVPSSSDANTTDYACSSCVRNGSERSIHLPPAFGSSPNLEALALEASISQVQNGDTVASRVQYSRAMHEITFAADDKPKLLSRLTALLAEIGLNIQEAHVFSTVDGYSLAVFVVDDWPFEETEQLQTALEKEVFKIEVGEPQETSTKYDSDHLTIPNDGTDVWEIDPQHLKYEKQIASGSYGDLYKGSYCSQEVAIKVLKSEHLDSDLQEFAQEIYIMRKVRHKNVVQFIELMSGGSVYDYLHKQKGSFKLPALLRVAIDISKGMNYLHQNNIIHRDLKAPNLLMDENDVVKVADFGVARVKAHTGVMTAETGTYRWMTPEVIEHKPYDHKADVFSFGIVLWELLTGKLPYNDLTPLQAAVGVVQKGLRPTIPKNTLPKLSELLEKCWQQDPSLRPDFSEIINILQKVTKEVKDDEVKVKSSGVFFSLLKRVHH